MDIGDVMIYKEPRQMHGSVNNLWRKTEILKCRDGVLIVGWPNNRDQMSALDMS